MNRLTPPGEPSSLQHGVEKLAGFDNWHSWHMKARMALQKMGLRHLLTHDGPQDWDDPEAGSQYAMEREAGVSLLVDRIGENMLARTYERGWKPESSTVQSTLYILELIINDEERQRRDDDQKGATTRKQITALARIDLEKGAKTVREYILEAKHCHDGLLALYVEGTRTTEELLEQLFVSSVVEGIKMAKPKWYMEWMEQMSTGTLGKLTTRAAVTDWLLAKDKEDLVEKDVKPPPPTAPEMEVKVKGGFDFRPPPKKNSKKNKVKKHCSYCADHHPKMTTHHDDDGCWFLNPDKAPTRWQSIFEAEVAEAKKGYHQGNKRKRSNSPQSSRD
ncbi:hypothetical protein NLG97_g7423 [Lecanicillium saksenae]|uniref:Uncharacterized protein n=1 Tax=Lecanicillium saksenae TaxID=468837 RepID=A0ACC1QNP0_9HYPO|nr:hypothetical protein NLG97_g7423 [Lecanicillium saksenae]